MSLANMNARSRYQTMTPVQKEARKAQMREYARNHRPAPKISKIGSRKKNASNSRREWSGVVIIERKLLIGSCLDCDLPCEEWNHVMFAFDHLDPSIKCFSMSKAAKIKGLTLEALNAEMDKCELVCHNCHAFRTYVERAHDQAPRLEPVAGLTPLFEL